MAEFRRTRSHDSTDSEEGRETQQTDTSDNGSTTGPESEAECRGARAETLVTYRCRYCSMCIRTTEDKARNHKRYCASKAKKKTLKLREKVGKRGAGKRKGKKGKQSKGF